MSNLKNLFVNFKSIFVSEDILKENEEHANVVTAMAMFSAFLISLLVSVLVYFNILKLRAEMTYYMLIINIILLLIPAIICRVLNGKGKWIKNLLFFCITIILAMTDALLKSYVALIMIVPVILSVRYFNKKFTIGIAVITIIIFSITTNLSANIGLPDLESYNSTIPKGTTITINNTLRDAVANIEVDKVQRLKNIFTHVFLPKLFIYSVVAFVCSKIAQVGKRMLEKQQEITKKSARIETELILANAIQKNMLPSIFPPFPEHKEIDIYASMTPAKEVGGDFYDMFLIDDNHLAICMADVSGKGVPASLFMMISKILIKNVSNIDKETDKALSRVNNMLCDGNKTGIFVTAWFGILDLTTGYLEFANAGHNPPLLYSKSNGKFEYLRTKPNMVLAGMENVNYTKNEIQIEPGDKIFLYTDGVTEAANFDNKLYGEDRLQSLLNNNIDLSVEETIELVKRDIDKFVGKAEQFDDITMLELLYKGKNAKESSLVKRKFKADTKELSNIQEFVETELEKYNYNSKTIFQINLVIEEVFVNIANYAYKDKLGFCTLTIQPENNKITFTFEDNGVPFNPLERLDPDISLSADKREVGGLGIFLTKKTMDEIKYKYENNKNILIITKTI